ncbi:hypothetical protein BJY59DRAFT_702201 [Rhodotorula toruloides]
MRTTHTNLFLLLLLLLASSSPRSCSARSIGLRASEDRAHARWREGGDIEMAPGHWHKLQAFGLEGVGGSEGGEVRGLGGSAV